MTKEFAAYTSVDLHEPPCNTLLFVTSLRSEERKCPPVPTEPFPGLHRSKKVKLRPQVFSLLLPPTFPTKFQLNRILVLLFCHPLSLGADQPSLCSFALGREEEEGSGEGGKGEKKPLNPTCPPPQSKLSGNARFDPGKWLMTRLRLPCALSMAVGFRQPQFAGVCDLLPSLPPLPN